MSSDFAIPWHALCARVQKQKCSCADSVRFLEFCMYLLHQHPFTSHEGSHMLAVKLIIDLKQLEKLAARPDAFRSLPTSCEVCRWPCRMKHVIMHIHCVTCTYMVINAASWTPQGKGMNNYCPSASYCEVCKTALCRAGASWNNTLECKQKPTTCLERALRLVPTKGIEDIFVLDEPHRRLRQLHWIRVNLHVCKWTPDRSHAHSSIMKIKKKPWNAVQWKPFTIGVDPTTSCCHRNSGKDSRVYQRPRQRLWCGRALPRHSLGLVTLVCRALSDAASSLIAAWAKEPLLAPYVVFLAKMPASGRSMYDVFRTTRLENKCNDTCSWCAVSFCQ